MAFFDDFGKRFSEVTSDLSGKAKDFSEQVKLEGEIRKAESGKKDLFQTIGKLFFEEQLNPESEKPDYTSLMDKVKEMDVRIENAKAKIAEMKEQAKLREEKRAEERAAAREAAREEAEREAAQRKAAEEAGIAGEADYEEAVPDEVTGEADTDEIKDGTWRADDV